MPDDAHNHDAALLLAVVAGDDAAFGALYRRYLPVVVRWCLRETGSREAAADLAAEVFAAVLVSARRYRPEQGSVVAWLFGIARNKLLESQRRSRVEDKARRRLGMDPVALSDSDLERVDELASLRGNALGLLDALPPEQKQALVGRIIDERPYEDLAAQLDCSASVVRQRVSRGLNTLKAGLEKR